MFCIPQVQAALPRLSSNAMKAEHDPTWQKALQTYRDTRIPPHTDDKVLCSWNSLMICALCRAAIVLNRPDYLAAAQAAEQFIRTHMMPAGRLCVRWRDGHTAHPGQLADYALYGLSLLHLYDATLQPHYLIQCEQICTAMEEQFADDQEGYFLYAHDAQRLILRPKPIMQSALPSGNGAAALLLQLLSTYTGKAAIRKAADRQLDFVAARLQNYPLGDSFALLALCYAHFPTTELVCAQESPEPSAALRAFWKNTRSYPQCFIWLKTPQTAHTLEQAAPFTADYPLPAGDPLYYLCRNGKCSAPSATLPQ